MLKFNVTFERYFPHADDEDVCEPDERGFVSEDVSLREAIEATGGIESRYEANEWPVRAPRWFTNDSYNEGTIEFYTQGISESRSLHLPACVTDSSRRRIARLLGVRTRD